MKPQAILIFGLLERAIFFDFFCLCFVTSVAREKMKGARHELTGEAFGALERKSL